jgi:hypothetical protein
VILKVLLICIILVVFVFVFIVNLILQIMFNYLNKSVIYFCMSGFEIAGHSIPVDCSNLRVLIVG